MLNKIYPYGTAKKVAEAVQKSPQYVREVLAGKAHNDEILEKALEIATELKAKRQAQNEKRKKIQSITIELKNGLQEEANEIVNQILDTK